MPILYLAGSVNRVGRSPVQVAELAERWQSMLSWGSTDDMDIFQLSWGKNINAYNVIPLKNILFFSIFTAYNKKNVMLENDKLVYKDDTHLLHKLD